MRIRRKKKGTNIWDVFNGFDAVFSPWSVGCAVLFFVAAFGIGGSLILLVLFSEQGIREAATGDNVEMLCLSSLGLTVFITLMLWRMVASVSRAIRERPAAEPASPNFFMMPNGETMQPQAAEPKALPDRGYDYPVQVNDRTATLLKRARGDDDQSQIRRVK